MYYLSNIIRFFPISSENSSYREFKKTKILTDKLRRLLFCEEEMRLSKTSILLTLSTIFSLSLSAHAQADLVTQDAGDIAWAAISTGDTIEDMYQHKQVQAHSSERANQYSSNFKNLIGSGTTGLNRKWSGAQYSPSPTYNEPSSNGLYLRAVETLQDQYDENSTVMFNMRFSNFVNVDTPLICPGLQYGSSPDTLQLNQFASNNNDVVDAIFNCTNKLKTTGRFYTEESKIIDFCGCVDRFKPKDLVLPSDVDEIYRQIDKIARPQILANSLAKFFEDLETMDKRYRHGLNGSQSIGFNCSDKKIDEMSERINGCFDSEALKLVDIQKNFDVNEDDYEKGKYLSFLTSDKARRKKLAKDRLGQYFSKIRGDREKWAESTASSINWQEHQQKFAKIFLVDVFKAQFDFEKNKDFSLDTEAIREYASTSPVLSHDYYAFMDDERAKVIKSTSDWTSEQNYSSMQMLEKEGENYLNEQFGLMMFRKLTNHFKKKGIFEKFIKLSQGAVNGDERALRNLSFLANHSFREIVDRENEAICNNTIDRLEKICDAENSNEYYKNNLSLSTFVNSLGYFSENNTVAVKDSALYCHAWKNGAIDSKAATAGDLSDNDISIISSSAIFPPSGSIGGTAKLDDNNDHSNSGLVDLDNPGAPLGGMDDAAIQAAVGASEAGNDYNFDEAANLFDNMNNQQQANDFPDSNVMDSQSLQSMVTDPNVSTEKMIQAKSDIEAEVKSVEAEIKENEKSNAVSTEQLKQNEELKAQLAALKAQINQLNTSIAKKADTDREESEAPVDVAVQAPTKRSSSSFNSFAGSGNRNTGQANNARTFTASNSAGGIGGAAAAAGSSFSSAGAGVAGINKLGATGGLGLTSGSGASGARSYSAGVISDNIAKSDQKLVAQAISEGSNSVVLADGRVYYIGQDEDGNVILSETAEEVLAGVLGPEEEGPQLPVKKEEKSEEAKRSIASEKEEGTAEESIYSKFLNAAEIAE